MPTLSGRRSSAHWIVVVTSAPEFLCLIKGVLATLAKDQSSGVAAVKPKSVSVCPVSSTVERGFNTAVLRSRSLVGGRWCESWEGCPL